MPWQPYYSREGGANRCCSGIVEKLIVNAWKKNNSNDKKNLRNW